jgi:hypothetical protein
MVVRDVHKTKQGLYLDDDELQEITRGIQLHYIVSLEIIGRVRLNFRWCLSRILPNLEEVSLSDHCNDEVDLILGQICKHCPKLQKVTWNYIQKLYVVSICGITMHSAENLKEIIMDDSEFYCWTDQDRMSSNIENHRNTFIFHNCSKALERVSIRNAKWLLSMNNNNYSMNVNPVPQNLLIKFVRNVPSLLWFRSDLTKENIDMLKLERPEVTLLN